MTTPLGVRLERSRVSPDVGALTPFRSLGTYAVWFPRGLLLRLAARRAALRLLNNWQETGESTARAEVQAACARSLAEPGLRPESLAARIDQAAASMLEGTAGEALTTLLANLEEQTQQYLAQDDPASWTKQALTKVQEWLGYGVSGAPREAGVYAGDWRKSRLTRALEAASEKLADEWSKILSETAFALMEHPGRRLATAEAAFEQLHRSFEEIIASHLARQQHQAPRLQKAQAQLEEALTACVGGSGNGWGFLFGNKPRRSLRVFMDHLAAFARQCLADDLVGAVHQCYLQIAAKLGERLRDLSFCRQRLRHLVQAFEAGELDGEEPADLPVSDDGMSPSPLASTESFWQGIQQSGTARVVLPNGEIDLERAAVRFVQTLTTENWVQLDQAVQDRVLGPRGGLQQACMGSSNMTKGLAMPLVEQLSDLLSSHLPITDVAEAERVNAAARHRDLATQIKGSWASAMPSVCTGDEHEQEGFLMVPASDEGKAFGEEARQILPTLQIVRVAGHADLTFVPRTG